MKIVVRIIVALVVIAALLWFGILLYLKRSVAQYDGSVATNVAAPVMTRLRQPQRLVLDTLVDAGVARSRSEALAWCVRLVGQHEADWLGELRDAMGKVADVRSKGPAA